MDTNTNRPTCPCTTPGHWHDAEPDGVCGMPLVRPNSIARGTCNNCANPGRGINVAGMDAAANRVRRNAAASRRTQGVIR